MIRKFSTASVAFRKNSVTQFSNLDRALAVSKKWQPTTGNSFRSFAEYRIKVVKQLPFTVRSKRSK